MWSQQNHGKTQMQATSMAYRMGEAQKVKPQLHRNHVTLMNGDTTQLVSTECMYLPFCAYLILSMAGDSLYVVVTVQKSHQPNCQFNLVSDGLENTYLESITLQILLVVLIPT